MHISTDKNALFIVYPEIEIQTKSKSQTPVPPNSQAKK